MTTTDYRTTQPLTIPDGTYNTDDIATLVVTGTTYGGTWMLKALRTDVDLDHNTPIGSIEVHGAARRPASAVEAARDWMAKECARLGVRLAHFEAKNDHYGPDEAPFFMGSLALIDRRKAA